jgi:hypothetical protein
MLKRHRRQALKIRRQRRICFTNAPGGRVPPALPTRSASFVPQPRDYGAPRRSRSTLPSRGTGVIAYAGLGCFCLTSDPPKDGLIRSHPALSPSPLGLCDLCRRCPARSIRGGEPFSFEACPYPVLPSRICQIIRHNRSFSPRSITCNGVEPSNASFGRCSHGPIAFAFMMSDKASKSRVTSRIFCALDRCGARPEFQYETVRGEAPVTLLTTSFERW